MKSEKLERYITADSRSSDEVNTELARLGPQYVEEIITLLLKFIRNLPEGIGPGTGMSEMQRVIAFPAIDKAWGIISGMGWEGIKALIFAIDSENHVKGVVACVILCVNNSPRQNVADEIYKLNRFIEFNRTTQVDRATQIIGNLTARVLSLSGAPNARKWIENLCKQKNISYDDWMYIIVESAICFVRDS